MSARKAHQAPEGLSERAARLWAAEAGPKRRTQSEGRLLLLEQALRHLDRADRLRQTIDAEGPTTVTKTTGALHLHPLLKVELTERALFVKLARVLELQWAHGTDGSEF